MVIPEEKIVKEVRRYGASTNAQQTTTTTTTTTRIQPPTKVTTKKTRYEGLFCSRGDSFGTDGLEPKGFKAQPKSIGNTDNNKGKGTGFVV